jgi:hypothetical protein
MVEFAINSSTSETTRFAPFELNHGYLPTLGRQIGTDTKYQGVKQFAAQAKWNLMAAHDAIIAHRVKQSHNANNLRRDAPEYKEGDFVYLSTKNITFPKGRVSKLIPRFVGPYKILSIKDKITVKLELPEELKKRRIHPVFHVDVLKPYIANDDDRFPRRDTLTAYDFGQPDDAEWHVDEILAHRWNGTREKDLEYLVQWTLGDTTWEPHENCKELQALDEYLQLRGVTQPRQLSRLTKTR